MNESNDFTLSRYKQYLDTIKKDWDIILFNEINSFDLKDRPKALIRHDIDLSLQQSLEIAKLEKEFGVKTTYFIHLQNEFYNVLEDNSQQIVRNIISLGHDIGVHFDINSYSNKIKKNEDIDFWAIFEKNIYEQLFDCKINTLSLHNPTLIKIKFNQMEDSIGGMLNTYGKVIFDKFKYISDSNGYWRFEKMDDFLKKNKNENIQFLSHPGWWTHQNLKPRQKIQSYVSDRAKKTLKNYDSILKKSNRKNIQ
tara:strand:+ start:267 stop:1022 length:756 start_codon:yes stop_codon:yes gene_type:complete